MNLRELIRLSLQRIGANPLRSALTMLGVIIGVASVVAVVSIGQGTGRRITTSIGSLGTNLLTINAGRSFSGLARGAAGSATTLTLGDATAVAAQADVETVAPSISSQQLVASGIQNETVSVVGTTPEYLGVHADQVWQGSFLTQPSQDLALRVAVIGSTTATNLKLGPANLGQPITIGGLPYRLIGILQPKGGVGSTDDVVIVPLSTLQHRISSSASLSSISREHGRRRGQHRHQQPDHRPAASSPQPGRHRHRRLLGHDAGAAALRGLHRVQHADAAAGRDRLHLARWSEASGS